MATYKMGKDFHQPHIQQRADFQNILRTQKTRLYKPNNPVKMGYKSKQRILNRRISNNQETLMDMFKILSHQENVNQNDSKIQSYTCQNG